jgi:hypothetical protein
MFRPLIVTSPRELTKWCAYALVLLAPGSFVVLPVLWLVRRFQASPTTRNVKAGGKHTGVQPA